MKYKEGRDFLQLTDCVVSVKDGKIILARMSSEIEVTAAELEKVLKWIKKLDLEKL